MGRWARGLFSCLSLSLGRFALGGIIQREKHVGRVKRLMDLLFFFKEIHRGVFFQKFSVFNFESPINLLCIAQKGRGDGRNVGGFSNR